MKRVLALVFTMVAFSTVACGEGRFDDDLEDGLEDADPGKGKRGKDKGRGGGLGGAAGGKSKKGSDANGGSRGSRGGTSSSGFVGTWSIQGTNRYVWKTPEGDVPGEDSLQGEVTIEPGSSSDLLIHIDDGCSLPATVEGDVAAIESGVTCVYPADNGTLTFVFLGAEARLSGGALEFEALGGLNFESGGSSVEGAFNWYWSGESAN